MSIDVFALTNVILALQLSFVSTPIGPLLKRLLKRWWFGFARQTIQWSSQTFSFVRHFVSLPISL